MSDALKTFGTMVTPQGEPIPGKDMSKNDAGGYVYTVDHWTRLHRFLILGSDGGTYYVGQRELTVANANSVFDCLKESGRRVVDMACEISEAGRAPKNDQAIFVCALAITHGDLATRQYVAESINRVCRIGTHIFQFAEYVSNLGGWGETKKRAVRNWLFGRTADELAYQMVKYRMREGWTQHDLHHVAHPRGDDKEGFNDLFKWAKGDPSAWHYGQRFEPEIIRGFNRAQMAKSADDVVLAVRNYKLPHEAIPTQFKTDPKVQDALLEHMPITALIRNLGNLSKSGLLTSFSQASKLVAAKLDSDELLQRGRVHPMSVLLALKTYEQGYSDKGKGVWNPVPMVVDALNEAFYKTFGNVEPMGGNVMLALDVSGSMGSYLHNSTLTCRDATAAMAMITARTEKNWMIGCFSTQFSVLSMSPTERLDDVIRRISGLPFGGTDCALPMIIAAQNQIPIDTFVVYTDNETWAGVQHPSQALVGYRRKMNKPNAKLVVVGMTATGFSIADPNDPGMLDVVGFDSSAPNVISDFARDN